MKNPITKKRILIYLGVVIGLTLVLFASFLFIRYITSPKSYRGGRAPDWKWCEYGYNYDTKDCCDEDDYSCAIRDRAPEGATGYCDDGTYTFAKVEAEACIDNGGLEKDGQFGMPFIVPPPNATAQCKDRTFSYSPARSGLCSGHGGVFQWLK
jgi:hypothetical protein